MTDKIPYSYTVLRYVHDVVTGEFFNVGVLVYAPRRGIFARTRKTIGRIRDAFPDLNKRAFTDSMRSIDRGVAILKRDIERSPLLSEIRDAVSVARRILPPDDSSLRWSPVGVGVTDNPQQTLDRLYARLVERYDEPNIRRRTDEEVWRPVKQKLEQRNLASRLQKATIGGPLDKIVFKHAWKNGQWQVYEPVSLDLADADGIKDKARRWLGHLEAVSKGLSEPFKPHFVVGAPQSSSLRPAYKNAVAILRHAPFQPEIFEEDQIDELVNQIEIESERHPT